MARNLIERFVDAWAAFCLSYRKTVLLVLAAVTAVTGAQLPEVYFDNALETWFIDGDPALVAHRELLDTFGSDELVVIGLEAPDVFAPGVLERIDRVTRAVEKVPDVEKVFSLTNVESIRGRGDVLEIRDLVEMPLDAAALPALRRDALADELYVGNVVSALGDFTAIVVRLPYRSDTIDHKVAAVGRIREILEAEHGARFYLSGAPVFDEQFFYQSEADSIRTTGLMLATLVVVLWLLTRSVWGVVLPLVTVSGATVWTLGAMVLAGVRINIIATILPPLLLAVGVAAAMHVLVDYQNRIREGLEKTAALRAVYRELFAPLFLTGLTTAIGMLSLYVSRVEAIRRFGLFSSFGVVAAFLLTVTFVPIVLSYLPQTVLGGRGHDLTRGRLLSVRALEGLHRFTMRRGHAIVAVALSIVTVAVVFAARVKAESSFLRIFKESSQIRVDTERIQEAMAGTITVDVLVDTGRDGGVKDPALLRKLVDVEAFLESQPYVTSAQSIAGYFKSMRRAMFGGDAREYRLPDTAEEAAQYLLLYEMDAPDGDLREFVTYDQRTTRVTARVHMDSSNAAAALVLATEEYLAHEMPEGVSAKVTGLLVMYADMQEYIRDSLVQGFSGALACIFLVFCVQMRSVFLGAVVMAANSMPILVTLGIMGATGIRLDSMTAMVASIAIGLADDDSIHFVSRVRLKLDHGVDVVTALRESLVEVGRALVYSGMALCAGFAVMLTASFVGAMYFGLLTMLTIALALVSDLVLLPVMLRWYDTTRRRLALLAPDAEKAVGS